MGMVKSVVVDPLNLLWRMTQNRPEYEVETKDFSSVISDATKKIAGKGRISDADANELIKSRTEMDTRGEKIAKDISKSITISLSDRTITAPNIPIIRDIVFKIKQRKINAQIEKTQEALRIEDEKTDSTVKAAIATNSFTGGKSAVKTKAAVKGDPSNQREQGGEVRTRKGR